VHLPWGPSTEFRRKKAGARRGNRAAVKKDLVKPLMADLTHAISTPPFQKKKEEVAYI